MVRSIFVVGARGASWLVVGARGARGAAGAVRDCGAPDRAVVNAAINAALHPTAATANRCTFNLLFHFFHFSTFPLLPLLPLTRFLPPRERVTRGRDTRSSQTCLLYTSDAA